MQFHYMILSYSSDWHSARLVSELRDDKLDGIDSDINMKAEALESNLFEQSV